MKLSNSKSIGGKCTRVSPLPGLASFPVSRPHPFDRGIPKMPCTINNAAGQTIARARASALSFFRSFIHPPLATYPKFTWPRGCPSHSSPSSPSPPNNVTKPNSGDEVGASTSVSHRLSPQTGCNQINIAGFWRRNTLIFRMLQRILR